MYIVMIAERTVAGSAATYQCDVFYASAMWKMMFSLDLTTSFSCVGEALADRKAT
jgi:hypothetical protein